MEEDSICMKGGGLKGIPLYKQLPSMEWREESCWAYGADKIPNQA
jgi:hypothetical protein